MKRIAQDDAREAALPPVPPGTPTWITPQLLAETIRTWQPYYEKPLTPEEAVAIIRNVGRLVDLLARGTES